MFRLKKQEEVVGCLFVAVSFVEVFLSQSVSFVEGKGLDSLGLDRVFGGSLVLRWVKITQKQVPRGVPRRTRT